MFLLIEMPLKKKTTYAIAQSLPLKGRANKYVTHFFTFKKKCLQSKYVTQPNQNGPFSFKMHKTCFVKNKRKIFLIAKN